MFFDKNREVSRKTPEILMKVVVRDIDWRDCGLLDINSYSANKADYLKTLIDNYMKSSKKEHTASTNFSLTIQGNSVLLRGSVEDILKTLVSSKIINQSKADSLNKAHQVLELDNQTSDIGKIKTIEYTKNQLNIIIDALPQQYRVEGLEVMLLEIQEKLDMQKLQDSTSLSLKDYFFDKG